MTTTTITPPAVRRSVPSDLLAVFGGTARLLYRHWPVLFALWFAGVAVRSSLMWLAVEATERHAILGQLILLLVPMSTLVALVLMLRTVRPSLSSLRSVDARHKSVSLISHLGAVLIPFLTVYSASGYLKNDLLDYSYKIAVDEIFNNTDLFYRPERVNVAAREIGGFGPWVLVAVLVAVVLRWLLTRWKAVDRRPWLGIPGAYVEVAWMTLVAITFNAAYQAASVWAGQRRAAVWVEQHWNFSDFGALDKRIHQVVTWLDGRLSVIDSVIVVPVAWLVIGAIVLGRQFTPPPPLSSELYERASRRWRRVPSPVRRFFAVISAETRARVTPVLDGLRLMARSGWLPMLTFCLLFLLVQSAGSWLGQLERTLIGPRDMTTFWLVIDVPLSTFNNAVVFVLLTCLLAAAVNQALRGQATAASPDGGVEVR